MSKKDVLLKKIVCITLWAVFTIYCLVLIKILFLDRFIIGREFVSFKQYFMYHTNFIPFKTIVSYAELLSDNRINLDIVITNLLGNLLLFLPMGMALPCLFKKLRRFRKTAVTVIAIIFFVEIIQLSFQLGSFDIDDFILNIAGAMSGYAVISVPFIRKLLIKTYVYPQG